MSLPQKPIIENINNSIQNGRSAMPQKALTSTNENPFSMNRVLYSKTIRTITNQTNDTIKEKHFYGENNRDASSVIARRKMLQSGNKNYLGNNVSYQGEKDTNDVRQAQKRVRNSGASVPAKKTHNYTGSPVFY
jgi:hypothetical protein